MLRAGPLVSEHRHPQHQTDLRILRDLGGPRAQRHRDVEAAPGMDGLDVGPVLVAVGPGDRNPAHRHRRRPAAVHRVRVELAAPRERVARRCVELGRPVGVRDLGAVDRRLVRELHVVAHLLAPARRNLVPERLGRQDPVAPHALADRLGVVEPGTAAHVAGVARRQRGLLASRAVLRLRLRGRHALRQRRLDPVHQLQGPTRGVGTLLALPLHHQPVPARPVTGAGALFGTDAGHRRSQRNRTLLLQEARGVRPAGAVRVVLDRGAQRVERVHGSPGLRHGRRREVHRGLGVQIDRVVPLLARPDGVQILPGYEGGGTVRGGRTRHPLASEAVTVGGQLGGTLELTGQRLGVRCVVIAAVARVRDALQLLAGRTLHLEADGVDPQPDPLLAELLGDLAGLRRTAVVLAVGDQQDRARPDGPVRGLRQVLCRLPERQADGGVPAGAYGRHGLLHRGPVELVHRTYEPGVRAALRLVGPVHTQAGGITVGEPVHDRADRRARALHPGAPRAVVVPHGSGRVEHHDQAAASVGPDRVRCAAGVRRVRHGR